jgi:hypothetical protein
MIFRTFWGVFYRLGSGAYVLGSKAHQAFIILCGFKEI